MSMGNIRTTDKLRDLAEAWFARLRAPDCNANEHDRFEDWCAADPRHAEAYADTEDLWTKLGALSAAPELVSIEQEAAETARSVPGRTERPAWDAIAALPLSRRAAPTRHTHGRWGAALSLAAALVVVAVGVWLVPGRSPPAPSLVFEATDQPRSVTLGDGSVLQLDVATRVVAQLAPDARHIALQQGRAIFAVAHDASRPFTVSAADSRVTALGTHFQVQSENMRVTVTLAEGVVQVQRAAPSGGAAMRTRLQPGEQLTYALNEKGWKKQVVDTAAATSWSLGRLVFHSTPLADAVAEINRYSPHKIRLAESELGRLHLSGTFRAGDARTVAAVLPAVLPVRVETGPSGEMLLHAK
jgi:transmembrane sensor